MTGRGLADALRWTEQGTALCGDVLERLDDDWFGASSALDGWTRGHLAGHLDGNARGLMNLVTWAATGVETPMYASPEQRLADIEAGAALAPDELRRRFARSGADLAAGMAALSWEQWGSEVRTAQGRNVPASEIPWLRAREVMVHAVDLDAGVGFVDLPEDFLLALIDDVMAKRGATPDHPALVVETMGLRWQVEGEGRPARAAGSPAAVAAAVTGRRALEGSPLPVWL